MKKVFIFFWVFTCSIAFAIEGQFVPSKLYFIKQGEALDVTNDILQNQKKIDGFQKVTVMGYVQYPGVYYFDSPIGLFDLIRIAGKLNHKDGSVSGSRVYVMQSSYSKETTQYDMERANQLLKDKPKSQPMLSGEEVIYRAGILF